MKKIYIMLTKTGSVFGNLIGAYTKEPYAHVSLLLSKDFTRGYSFSRKELDNPFIGGFMCEDYTEWVKVFPKTTCRLYQLNITSSQYDDLIKMLYKFCQEQEKYKYNTLGVLGRVFHLNIKLPYYYFCSQFVSYILSECNILSFKKTPICTTAIDFKNHVDLELIYEGFLTGLIS